MDDAQLWQAFETQTLAESEWTHQAHLRVAFLFAQRFELDEAHLRMRAGIIRLNARHGLIESGVRGYFETLTRIWLVLVRQAAIESGVVSSLELLGVRPELLNRELPLKHYTRARLFSVQARSIYVPPDREPLPL